MDDKHKVLTNPLLSGANHTNFLQDYVNTTLIVPAAPTNDEHKINESKNTAAVKGNPSGGGGGEVSTSSNLTKDFEHPQILSPFQQQQQQQKPVPIGQPFSTSTLTDIPLDGSINKSVFTTTATNLSVAGPPPIGAPPLTSYSRHTNKLSAHKYPSPSYLQTIPSAPFPIHDGPQLSTPVTSISNVTTSIGYFVPGPVTTVPQYTAPVDTPKLQICPQAPPGHVPAYLKQELTSSTAATTPFLEATHPSILTPVNVSSPLPHKPLSNSVTSGIVPSLPVSQPIILPSSTGVFSVDENLIGSSSTTSTTTTTSSTALLSQNIESVTTLASSIFASCTVVGANDNSAPALTYSSQPSISVPPVTLNTTQPYKPLFPPFDLAKNYRAPPPLPYLPSAPPLDPLKTAQVTTVSSSNFATSSVPLLSQPPSSSSFFSPISSPPTIPKQVTTVSSLNLTSSVPPVSLNTTPPHKPLFPPFDLTKNYRAPPPAPSLDPLKTAQVTTVSSPSFAPSTIPLPLQPPNSSTSLFNPISSPSSIPQVPPSVDSVTNCQAKNVSNFPIQAPPTSSANFLLNKVENPTSQPPPLFFTFHSADSTNFATSLTYTPPEQPTVETKESSAPSIAPSSNKNFTSLSSSAIPPLFAHFFTPPTPVVNPIQNTVNPQTGFSPLPPKVFTPPQSTPLQTIPNPSAQLAANNPKPTSSTSSSPSVLETSHTPPPPYSSLPCVTNLTHLQSNTDGIPPSSGIPQNLELKDEDLDQIPLDENTVPLYNPLTVEALSHHHPPTSKGETQNTYRLRSGLKRPSYAPVPDLASTQNNLPHPIPFSAAVATAPTIMSEPQQQQEPQPSAPPLSLVPDINQTAVDNTSITATANTPPRTPPSSVASSPSPETTSSNFNVMDQGQTYRAPYHHWFYKKENEMKNVWQPFTMADSLNLEQIFTSPDLTENTKVPTDGGRYDVEVLRRRKVAVYWKEPAGEVRRCSWFVRAPIESRYIPYDENIAELLEDAYRIGCMKNEWNRKIDLADGEVIIFHSPSSILHYQRSSSPDAWGNTPTMQQKPRFVKRGLENVEISEGEPNQVDHLLLMVHGIGKVCDLRFRSLVQVVDDFRHVSLQLVQSHFRSGTENGNVGRVEVLPVEWHRALHTEIIDKRLSDITLPSIPRAREFTNDVLLDILFYTSPVFCERIVQAVGAEINRVYDLYMSRNPGFRGGVSLGGHSLGSLILFDMLCHQKPHQSIKSALVPTTSISESDEDMSELGCLKTKARLSRRMSYLTIGKAGTGQPYIAHPQLNFQPKAFFALGSPIGMFLTVRGIESLGEEFKFPTCPKFFNIFHPNDPVAYRIEPLISPQMVGVPPIVIPHHKGRKRMHLELKDTMAHVTTALKQKLIDSMRSTWNAVYQLAMFHRPDSSIQQEVDKVIENEILSNTDCETSSINHFIVSEHEALNMIVGKLNGGNRIDYVLQEAPLETFNQYISAVRSHVVYWESEDTTLLILKELYATMGISPDCQVPQPILPFDISTETTGNESYSEYTDTVGAPPTQFIRK